MKPIKNSKLKMQNCTAALLVSFFIFNFAFCIEASAADLGDAIDCAADGRLLDSHFARYGYQPTRTIVHEAQGIRIYLPALTQSVEQTGLYSYFAVAGDFDVAANYEVLGMPKPQSGYGVSCGIAVDTKGPGGMVAITRGETVGKGSTYVVTRGKQEAGETKYDSTFYPTTAKTGRLILRREKADVICLAADGPQAEPRELIRLPFVPDTIRQVRLFGDLGGSHTSLDARLTQIQIRAVEIAGGVPKYEPPRPWGWGWWAGLGSVGVVAVGLMGFRFRSGRWPWAGSDD
jgi:hypothetical protein